MNLKDKVVLLTGASSGIGKSLAIQLAQKGAKLALCGRTPSKLEATLQQIKLPEGNLLSKSFDVTDEQACIAFVQQAFQKFGRIDYLINNAGANTQKASIIDISTQDFDTMYQVNFKSAFVFMREVGRIFKTQQSGQLVNVLSSSCKFAARTMGSYSSHKSGLDCLTDIFRKEMMDFGVKTLSVYPGGTDTDFRTAERPEYMRAESAAQAIVNALELPEDVCMHDLTFRPLAEENFK